MQKKPQISFGDDVFDVEALLMASKGCHELSIDASEVADDYDTLVTVSQDHDSSKEMIAVYKREGRYYALLGKQRLTNELKAGQAVFKVRLLTKHVLKRVQTIQVSTAVHNRRVDEDHQKFEASQGGYDDRVQGTYSSRPVQPNRWDGNRSRPR